MVQALLEARVPWQGGGGNKEPPKSASDSFFLLSSMFGWFVQGLEKVMPQPVSREKQDTQVRSLQRGNGGVEAMCKAGEGPGGAGAVGTGRCAGTCWLCPRRSLGWAHVVLHRACALPHSSVEKRNPHSC